MSSLLPFALKSSHGTAVIAALCLFACEGESARDTTPATADDGELSIVEPGKEDNFLSLTAREYAVTGTTQVRLESSWAGKSKAARLARAKELVPFRQVVVGWFLSQYIGEKESKDANARYGGFRSLTKNGSWDDLGLREVDELTFEMEFRQELGGPLDLLSVLPTQLTPEGRRYFDLQIGRVDTEEMQKLDINSEWYRQKPWDGFNPKTVPADRQETVRLFVEPEARSNDGWFDYAGLMDDGVLDIAVHFGWDYHSEYHLKHSRATYDELIDRGFTSPVAKYGDLKRTSGPLTTRVTTPAGEVEVRVSLFWGQPGTETDPDTDAGGRVLEKDMRESLKNRDVIVFSGHSGPFYGFALANWKKTEEGDLDDAELPEVEMPDDRSQLVFAEGCDTYAIGEGFFQNPAKRGGHHLDVITTTSYSNAETPEPVYHLLDVFTTKGTDENIRAWRLTEFLEALDGTSPWFSTMYGVHGIDDNPRAHPWAEVDGLCGECSKSSDCGPAGNRCVKMNGVKACTFECTADDACGEGLVCQSAQRAGTIEGKVCVTPRATCDTDDAARKPLLVLDSAVPNPDRDLNGDGKSEDRSDESVTVKNAGGAEVSLSGWSLADSVGVRFTFARGYKLAAGASVTVFGAGAAAGGQLFAPSGLSLNNRNDAVRLLDARGGVVDSLAWHTAGSGIVVRH